MTRSEPVSICVCAAGYKGLLFLQKVSQILNISRVISYELPGNEKDCYHDIVSLCQAQRIDLCTSRLDAHGMHDWYRHLADDWPGICMGVGCQGSHTDFTVSIYQCRDSGGKTSVLGKQAVVKGDTACVRAGDQILPADKEYEVRLYITDDRVAAGT